jgi:hypothetical protein
MIFLFDHLVVERILAERLESCRATVLWRDSKHRASIETAKPHDIVYISHMERGFRVGKSGTAEYRIRDVAARTALHLF